LGTALTYADWIRLAEDSDRWRDFANAELVM
jgi:hypothetical protein